MAPKLYDGESLCCWVATSNICSQTTSSNEKPIFLQIHQGALWIFYDSLAVLVEYVSLLKDTFLEDTNILSVHIFLLTVFA